MTHYLRSLLSTQITVMRNEGKTRYEVELCTKRHCQQIMPLRESSSQTQDATIPLPKELSQHPQKLIEQRLHIIGHTIYTLLIHYNLRITHSINQTNYFHKFILLSFCL